MRRGDRGLVLGALGVFALAAALTLLVVGPSLLVVPLDARVHEVSTGRALAVFDPAALTVRIGVQATLTTNAIGRPTDPLAGPRTAVYEVGSVLDDRQGDLIAADIGTVCLDRPSGESTDCVGSRSPAPPGPPVGQQVIAFPFDTARRDYGVLDASGAPIRYTRDVGLDGLHLYEFRQTVRDVVTRRMQVPGRLAGAATDASVDADLVFGTDRVYWVEPVSGVVVMRSERPSQAFRAPDGRVGPPLLFGKYRLDDATVAADVERASAQRWRILLVRSVLPWALGLGGAALLLAGVLVTRRTRRD